MAGLVLMQASPSALVWGSRERCCRVRGRGTRGNNQMKSFVASPPAVGIGIGGRGVRNCPVYYVESNRMDGCHDSRGLFRMKNSRRNRVRVASSCGVGSRNCGDQMREVVVSAWDNVSRDSRPRRYGRENGVDANMEDISRRGGRANSAEFFIDQPYEYETGEDSFRRDRLSAPEVLNRGNSAVRTVIPEQTGLKELSKVHPQQVEAEEPRRIIESRELVQPDEEGRFSEEYGRWPNRETGEVNLVDAYAGNGMPEARREDKDQVIGRSREMRFYEEIFEEDKRVVKSPFTRYERDSMNDQTASRIFPDQPQRFARGNGEADDQSVGPSGKDENGAGNYDRQLGSRTRRDSGDFLRDVSSSDQSQMNERQLVSETGKGCLSRRGEYLDDPPYLGRLKEITEKLSFEDDLQMSEVDGTAVEELWQRPDRRSSESYPLTFLDSRLIDRESSTSILRKDPDYEMYSPRRSPDDNKTLEKVNQKWGPSVSNNIRTDFRKIGNYEGSDEEFDQVATRKSTGIDRKRNENENEQEVLVRGAVYAKQVISQETAQSLGFVSQLWVNMQSFKVVALEVRPNLLYGDLKGILLKSVRKVGDVILIHGETVILEELDLFNCFDLVGSDLLTENGFYLGKVRDYDFSLDDGTVFSLEFDTFGVPLIPASVISTYSLTVDEVIEAEEDSLLLQKGAEKRVRRLTKGLFSRPKQPAIGRRKGVQQLTSSRSSYNKTAEIRYLDSSMDKPPQRNRTEIGKYEDSTPRLSTPGRKQLQRDKVPAKGEKKSETNSAGDVYPEDKQVWRNQQFNSLESDELETFQESRKEKKATSEIPDARQRQSSGNTMAGPGVSPHGRGLPMSY